MNDLSNSRLNYTVLEKILTFKDSPVLEVFWKTLSAFYISDYLGGLKQL